MIVDLSPSGPNDIARALPRLGGASNNIPPCGIISTLVWVAGIPWGTCRERSVPSRGSRGHFAETHVVPAPKKAVLFLRISPFCPAIRPRGGSPLHAVVSFLAFPLSTGLQLRIASRLAACIYSTPQKAYLDAWSWPKFRGKKSSVTLMATWDGDGRSSNTTAKPKANSSPECRPTWEAMR